MNDRIKELAKQAGFYITIDGSGIFIPDPSTEDITEVSEKFAELIVRECVRYFNEEYARDFATSWRKDLSKGMKEHFGVAE